MQQILLYYRGRRQAAEIPSTTSGTASATAAGTLVPPRGGGTMVRRRNQPERTCGAAGIPETGLRRPLMTPSAYVPERIVGATPAPAPDAIAPCSRPPMSAYLAPSCSRCPITPISKKNEPKRARNNGDTRAHRGAQRARPPRRRRAGAPAFGSACRALCVGGGL